MTTTHDDNALSWRELADALTPEQIAYIENWEAHPDLPPVADGSSTPSDVRALTLLRTAREFVETNAASALYADVAPPVGVQFVDAWQQWDDTYSRIFGATKRQVDEHIHVEINGTQHCDGRIERVIQIVSTEKFRDGEMSSTQARLVATALIEAADELERLGR